MMNINFSSRLMLGEAGGLFTSFGHQFFRIWRSIVVHVYSISFITTWLWLVQLKNRLVEKCTIILCIYPSIVVIFEGGGIIFLQYKTKMLTNSSLDAFYFLSIDYLHVNLEPGYQCRSTLTSKITVEKSHVRICPIYFVIPLLEFCSLGSFMPLANILNVWHLSLCLQTQQHYFCP